MAINETIQITQEQFLKMHYNTVIPNIIAMYLFTIFSFLFIGLNIVKHDKKKYFTIWIYSTIISALFLVFLVIFPDTTQTVINFFESLFS